MSGLHLPLLRPMLAVGAKPFDSAAHLYEIKWDGYRGLVYLDGGTVIRSRNLIDLTGKFPELAGLHHQVRRQPAIIDGEIVLPEHGKPSFAGLQARSGAAGAGRPKPVVFIAFDVLYAGGAPVLGQPLRERKKLLAQMVAPDDHILLSSYVVGDGVGFYQACVKQGLEGAVAKSLDSVYLPGRRSAHWKKFRHVREADLVICGYQPGRNGLGLGALILGGKKGGKLVFQGKVGTGFSQREAGSLLAGLRQIETREAPLEIPAPERGRTRWVRPLLVCAVQYLTATAGGYLRHPVYRGLRWDKAPGECPAIDAERTGGDGG